MFPWTAAPSPEPSTATYRRKISLGRPHGRQPPVGGQHHQIPAENPWASSQSSYGGNSETWLGRRFSAVAKVAARLTKVGGNKVFQEITGPIGRRDGEEMPRVRRKSVVLEEPGVNPSTIAYAENGAQNAVRFEDSAAAPAAERVFAAVQGDEFGGGVVGGGGGGGGGRVGGGNMTGGITAAQGAQLAGRDTTAPVAQDNGPAHINAASRTAPGPTQGSILNPLSLSPNSRVRAAGVPRFPGKIAGVPVTDDW